MRRSASFQRLLIYGLSGPIIALNVWLLSVLFQLFPASHYYLQCGGDSGFFTQLPR